MKTYIGQIEGPFKAKESLTSKIKNPNQQEIELQTFKLSIFSCEGHHVNVNGIDFEIGKTGMLELNPLNLKNIYFLQAESASSFIDYMAF